MKAIKVNGISADINALEMHINSYNYLLEGAQATYRRTYKITLKIND